MSDQFAPIDYGDLADVVQRLRVVDFRGFLGPARLKVHVPWFEDVDGFPAYIEQVSKLMLSDDSERAQEARIIVEEVKRLHAALRNGPRKPSPDEVVARYVGGEIGDRTARYVMGWDSWQLIDECRKRNLPPMQMIDGAGEHHD